MKYCETLNETPNKDGASLTLTAQAWRNWPLWKWPEGAGLSELHWATVPGQALERGANTPSQLPQHLAPCSLVFSVLMSLASLQSLLSYLAPSSCDGPLPLLFLVLFSSSFKSQLNCPFFFRVFHDLPNQVSSPIHILLTPSQNYPVARLHLFDSFWLSLCLCKTMSFMMAGTLWVCSSSFPTTSRKPLLRDPLQEKIRMTTASLPLWTQSEPSTCPSGVMREHQLEGCRTWLKGKLGARNQLWRIVTQWGEINDFQIMKLFLWPSACLVSDTVIPSGQRECVCFDHCSAHSSWKRALALLHEWQTEWTGGRNNTSRIWGAKRCWNDVAQPKRSLGGGDITPASATIHVGWRIQLLRPALASPTAGILAAVSPSLLQLAGVCQTGCDDHTLTVSRLHWATLAATKQATWAGGSGMWHGPDRNLWAGSATRWLTLPTSRLPCLFIHSLWKLSYARCSLALGSLRSVPLSCHPGALSSTADVSNWSVAGLNWDMLQE